MIPQTVTPIQPAPSLPPVRYNEVCFVQLGRYGDILNLLPILKYWFDTTGIKPSLLVAKQFKDIELWASYYNLLVWDGPYDVVKPAVRWAEARFNQVFVTQPAAKDHMLDRQTTSFAMESWRAAGYLGLWGKLPLVLDKRLSWAESALVSKHIQPNCPNVLLAIASHSSPFEKSDELTTLVKCICGGVNLVNLTLIRARTVIDLLGLMDSADLLITVDTSTLHLAVASQVPVVAFISDLYPPWSGTETRCNVVWKQPYKRAIDLAWINKVVSRIIRPRIFAHATPCHTPDDQREVERHRRAWQTWPKSHKHQAWLKLELKPERSVAGKPFLRDIFDQAAAMCGDDDVIVYSNSDVAFCSDTATKIAQTLAAQDCLYSFRRDFMAPVPTMRIRDAVETGIPYDGCDLFCCTKAWWLGHRDQVPDFIVGDVEWDRVLRRIMEAFEPKARFDGLIYHECHPSSTNTASHNKPLAAAAPAIMIRATPVGVEDLILRHYRRLQRAQKHALIDFSKHALSNNALGLGDIAILTAQQEAARADGVSRSTWHPSTIFGEICSINGWNKTYSGEPLVSADYLQTTFDMGNGHFTQRLQRAFGLNPSLVPSPHIAHNPSRRKRGRCAIHLEAGRFADWQRDNLHCRARQIYSTHMAVIQEFISRHGYDMEFVEVGRKPSGLRGVRNATAPRASVASLVVELEQCEWFIGIMSGPMHIATAVGCKCVVVVNFPHAQDICLPCLKDIALVESEWFYPQHVHLHQDGDSELVKQFSIRNLELAFEGAVYPFWSEKYLPLIHEKT
jgi:ADP-heptose:LPS heptosyltransferase